MRIGIDARFLTNPQAGGFRTYTGSLLTALASVDQQNEYILYLDRASDDTGMLGPNFRIQPVPEEVPLIGMVWREQIALSRQIARDHLDIFHAPCLTAPLRLTCPSVVTIHDMIWHRPVRLNRTKPSLKHLLLDAYYRHIPERAARKAAAVLTVSEAAREQIVAELKISPEHVRVTYEAADSRFGPVKNPDEDAKVCARFGLSLGFILAMGSADPRKNVAGLMRSYADLPLALRERHPLAVVWTHRHLADKLQEEAQALGIGPHLHFLQNVSDNNLVALYHATGLFVFPSRYEGFGLPLLEAMACGAPVVAADNSSIPEIVGDAALMVSAEDRAGLTHCMARVLTEEPLRLQMIERGQARASEFSWERCARETLAVYREAAQVGP
jgi:glycosyltransferase involved in cell wall biosynthesis